MTTPAPTRQGRQSLGTIFLVPAILAALSCAGLVSALVGDGVWDGLSWLTLSVPIAVAVWCVFRRRKAVEPK